MRRLEMAENAILRWMCGATFKERLRSAELMDRLGIECVEEMVSGGRLRWYRNMEHKDKSGWVSACMVL